MKISVIIPTLNEESEIAGAIDSTRLQGECEIIVADGGSSDRTRELTEQAERCLNVPRGRARQQNAGAEASTGDVLLFLHADCRLLPGALDAICAALADSNCIGGCFRQSIDANGFQYRLLEFGNAFRVKVCKWAYGDQGIFVRRDVFQQLGGFPDLELMEDLFFMKRLKRAGRIALLDARIRVSPRRWQKNGVVRTTLRNWMWIALVQCGISPNRLAKSYAEIR